MSKAPRVRQLSDGDTVVLYPGKDNLKVRCCDCGLVHLWVIDSLPDGSIHLRLFRDKRSTAQTRRRMREAEVTE